MAKKKKKKVDAGGPPGAPEWVVTFTDMISLLVTFFVLLLTFSSTEDYDRLRVRGFLAGSRGALKSMGGHIARETMDEDLVSATDIRRGADLPHSRPPEELQENLEEMGQKKTDAHQEVDFAEMKDGLRIVFGPEESFRPGSATVNEALRKSLGEIGRVMQHYPHLVVVEGFTDDQFTSSDRFQSPEALSLARAVAAVEVLLEESAMTPNLVQVAGIGPHRPLADNATTDGRRRNRRVEIRVVALSKTRMAHYESQERERNGSREGARDETREEGR